MRTKFQTALILLGVVLYLYGASAIAQSIPPIGPDYQVWFTILVGLIVAMIGAYAKGISTRVDENAAEIGRLRQSLMNTQLQIATDHSTKSETNAQFSELRAAISAVHRRLDFLRVPSAFQVSEDK